jgi:ankyrin repeat protein
LCRTHHDEHLLGAITILVRHGADANVRDEKNLTALHEVCLFYQRSDLGSVIDQLLSAKATCINYGAMHKRTALHLIAIHYHGDNLPELIDSMIGRHGIISFFFYSFFIVFLLIIVAYVRYRCRSKSK